MMRARRLWKKFTSDPKLRLWGQFALTALAIAFLLYFLVRSVDELRQLNDWQAYIEAIGVSVLLYPLSFVIQAIIWQGKDHSNY